MSASAELQKLIFDTLVANADVHAYIGDRIYDFMPRAGSYPCVTFGAADAVEDDAECIEAWEEVVTLHCWSQDQGRLRPCKQICSTVRDTLHEADLVLPDPYALHEIRITRFTVRLDPDNITAHGVLDVTAQVQKI